MLLLMYVYTRVPYDRGSEVKKENTDNDRVHARLEKRRSDPHPHVTRPRHDRPSSYPLTRHTSFNHISHFSSLPLVLNMLHDDRFVMVYYAPRNRHTQVVVW